MLITFEGGEGGGKTTQVVRLKEFLIEKGYDVIVLREPGGTMISEQIRDVVLSSKNTGMADTTEVLLFQAARSQIYRELVIPSIKAEKVVIMDRSADSSIVYQGYVRGFDVDQIKYLNKISTNNTKPDITFLLDVPVDLGLKRRVESGKVDRLDMESKSFHEKVRNEYIKLSMEEPDRWKIIDASSDIDLVTEKIISIANQIL